MAFARGSVLRERVLGPLGMRDTGFHAADTAHGWVTRRSPRGDAEELAACFNVHASDLFGYARVLVRGDRALADDLVQAAFEAAGRAWWNCLTRAARGSSGYPAQVDGLAMDRHDDRRERPRGRAPG